MKGKFLSGEIVYIPVQQLEFLNNPFDGMSQAEFEELKESIKANGLVYEVTVVEHPEQDGKYVVVDGRNRVRALIDLGENEIPCRVLKVPKYQGEVLTYEVELYRRHLSPETRDSKRKEKRDIEKAIKSQLKTAILRMIPDVSNDLKQTLTSKDFPIDTLIDMYETTQRLKNNPIGQEVFLRGVMDHQTASQVAEDYTSEFKEEMQRLKEELQEKEDVLDTLRQDLQEKEALISRLMREKEEALEKAKKELLRELERRKAELKEEALKEATSGQVNEKLLEEYRRKLEVEYGEKLSKYEDKIRELTNLVKQQRDEKDRIGNQIRSLKERLRHLETGSRQLQALLESSRSLNRQVVSVASFYAKLDCVHADVQSLITLYRMALDKVRPDVVMSREEFQNFLNRWRELKKKIDILESLLNQAQQQLQEQTS